MRLKADRKFGCCCFDCAMLCASFHSLLQPLADCVSSNFFPLLVGMKAKFAPFGISKGISREIQCQHPGTHTHSFCFAFEINENGSPKLREPIVVVLIRRRSIRIRGGGWWACFQSRLALLLLHIGIYSIPYMHSRLKIKI